MSYNNSSGHPSSMNYVFSNSGDASATADYMVQSDSPSYTARFYSASQHENFTEFKYDKISIDYDLGLKEVRDSVQGLPLEAYIPGSGTGADLGSSPSKVPVEIIVPDKKEVEDEIEKAQRMARKGKIMLHFSEEKLIIRTKKTKKLIIKKK